VLDDESPHGKSVADVGAGRDVRRREPGVVEVERPDRVEGALEAFIVGERAVPERAVRRPLLGGRAAARIVLGARHEVPTGRRPHDRQLLDRRWIPRPVHQAEESPPADPEHVDRSELEPLSYALDIGDQLILRALLDRHPLRAPVAAVVVENHLEMELGGQRPQSPREPRRVGARTTV